MTTDLIRVRKLAGIKLVEAVNIRPEFIKKLLATKKTADLIVVNKDAKNHDEIMAVMIRSGDLKKDPYSTATAEDLIWRVEQSNKRLEQELK